MEKIKNNKCRFLTISIKFKRWTFYQVALKRFELLFDAKLGTPESDEADILSLLIDEFENKNYPIESFSNCAD